MKGQWFGNYEGSNNGFIIVDVDEHSPYFSGMVYLYTDTESLPGTGAFFVTENKNKNFKFRTHKIAPINPKSSSTDRWDNVTIPEYADVTGSWSKEELKLSWSTNIGTHGSCILPCSKADQESELPKNVQSWKEFKNNVASPNGRKLIFRGQNEPWRLRTSFHRAGRFNLDRFKAQDIQVLHRYLSARTRHVFNLEIISEYGAFCNLVQHHEYPTPLLDWTYSPYVAAFFAYRGISSDEAKRSETTDTVRIYTFKAEQWKKDLNQLLLTRLYIAICEFIAVENERMIPQQAVSLVTNIDDIESYILSHRQTEQHLLAVDLPVNNRDEVIQELDYMGITAGSLFPGLDGACEELKERNF